MHGRLKAGFLRLGAFALACALGAAASPATLRGQDPGAREAAVIAVFEKLFDGMRARDSVTMRSVFDPSARLVRAVTRDGRTTVQVTTVDQFVSGISRAPSGEELIERIYEPEVRIDGNLATIWTFYTFHLGERFSHCGIDAAQLLETDQGWKIIHISDTMRRENCEPPSR